MKARQSLTLLLMAAGACSSKTPEPATRQSTPAWQGSSGAGVSSPTAGDRAGMSPPDAKIPDAVVIAKTGPTVVKQQETDAQSVLDGSCAVASVRSKLVPSNLLFVIDRSGSMLCNPPPTTGSPDCEAAPRRARTDEPSKWEITKRALKSALAQLPSSTRVGISYFSNDDRCGVHSQPSVAISELADMQRSALGASLEATEPGGGTPLVGATILAYKHLHDLDLAGQTGNDFVVLLTDGEQSEQCGSPMRCSTAEECTDLLLQEVPKAAGRGADIRTFVIGAPGSEPARTVLSAMAVAGKTAAPGCDPASGECHFDMTRERDFSAALSSALGAISGEAARCELPLPEPEDDAGQLDLSLINVVFTPGTGKARVLPQDIRLGCDAGANGWQFTESNAAIRLCGSSCADVRSEPSAQLDVVLGCPIQGPS